jgi:hypothetical protein
MSFAFENNLSFFLIGIIVLLCLAVCIDEFKTIHCIQPDENPIEWTSTDLIIDLSNIYIQPDLVLNPFFIDSFLDTSDNPLSVV